MSANEQVLNNGQQAITNYDTSSICLWNNRFDTYKYTNGTGSEITIKAGTIMGQISANAKVAPLDASSSDGSQMPIGILCHDIKVANGVTVDLSICVSGHIATEKLVFADPTDTLDTVVSGRTLRARIGADTVGIRLVSGTEMTDYDNQ